jgi:hypothetical protein
MLPDRAAKQHLRIQVGDNTPAYFVPEDGQSRFCLPERLHLPARNAASR